MNKEFYCQILIFSDKQIIKIDTYKVDHHYPGSENRSHVVVLYGELGTSEFSEMHHILRNYAQKGAVDYVLRHYVKVSFKIFFKSNIEWYC